MLPHGQITRLKFKLPTIYPITNAELAGTSHTEQVRSLAAAGCRFVQIREKAASSRDFFEEVASSLKIAREAGMTLIVNDRLDISIVAGAHGIHLGQEDIPPAEARKLLGDTAIIGYSTHSIEQAIEAARLPLDYVAIGPVFTTSTKENPDPVVGLQGISIVRDAVGSLPVVAIGGINIGNLKDVLASGADSVAIISDLFVPNVSLGDRYISHEKASGV